MGTIIVFLVLLSYVIGNRYIEDPQIVTLILLIISAILITISYIIISSFERLAEANRMKSEFISVVSHQLRSPLSNFKWVLDFLMSGRIDLITEKQLEYFKILKDNSDRMQGLVQDLLIVSRIETAKLPMKMEEFSIEDLTSSLIEGFGPFARASNIEIKLVAENDLPKVFADSSRIRLVVENLLDNAVRYIKSRGEVSIKLSKGEGDIHFEINDNGVGIPKEDQKYIFQKFFRAENVMRYQTQGSGLGLYIAKSIIERSRGKIGFKSQEGKGSTFWFTLPIK